MTAEDCEPAIPATAYGMQRWQLDAWEADVAVDRIPDHLGAFQVVRFDRDDHGTIWDGYVLPESRDAGLFVLGWLVGRESIA
ncbi:hypothetical protein Enr13x_28090 [Stieleria neptunia]|uniref:Uncharacterized protein n=1 Tax=Stieleria neptunia TaxID=2527979 RepID=A0A518HQ84_9BACT|nr:hypothetical protein [Stieleria neptunia]QDV42957.1 hypothetical protein Enr13x_28090 [Stieleria neptunia]